MKRQGRSVEEQFGDSSRIQLKIKHVSSWIKRRIIEEITGTIPSCLDVNGDRKQLLQTLFGTERPLDLVKCQEDSHSRLQTVLDSIQAEVLPGGATNFAIRVWSNFNNVSPSSLGLFIKIALPYARWSKLKKPCPVSRFDREFIAFKRLNDLCPPRKEKEPNEDSPTQCPGVTSLPLLCGLDEEANDGTCYIAIKFLPRQYGKYLDQFIHGVVDKQPAEALGYTLAKLHVQSLSQWDKRSLLDETLLQYIANGHYKRIEDDQRCYIENTEFESPEVQANFFAPIVPKIALKHSNLLRDRPEVMRAISRHWDNLQNPPLETATFTHMDTHVINVLVSRSESKYPYTVDDPEYNPSDEGLMKLIDMEFSNWGPAGADLGLFMASAFFYALVHSYDEEAIKRSDTIISSIRAIWHAYRTAYIRFARQEGRSDDAIFLALFRIAHEALGRSGLWILRFTSPSLYPHVCLSDFLYALPDGLGKQLASVKSTETEEDGLEILRMACNTFAMDSLVAGFGDDAYIEYQSQRIENLTLARCNEKMNWFVNHLVMKRSRLHESLQRARRRPASD